MRTLLYIALIIGTNTLWSQQKYPYQFAVMKYNGGGDWYSNPTSVPNLVKFCNDQSNMSIDPDVAEIHVSDPEIFNYPFVHLTGHGNVVFSSQEAQNLRLYLMAGGFLHIDDNYGMDEFIRPQLKLVFPELDLIEIPFNHPIYHQEFNFKNGLPKVHEHDGKAPQGFGLIFEGRLVCFYSYECDLGDGWEDPAVHNDPAEARKKALQMGYNLVQYAFMDGIGGN